MESKRELSHVGDSKLSCKPISYSIIKMQWAFWGDESVCSWPERSTTCVRLILRCLLYYFASNDNIFVPCCALFSELRPHISRNATIRMINEPPLRRSEMVE